MLDDGLQIDSPPSKNCSVPASSNGRSVVASRPATAPKVRAIQPSTLASRSVVDAQNRSQCPAHCSRPSDAGSATTSAGGTPSRRSPRLIADSCECARFRPSLRRTLRRLGRGLAEGEHPKVASAGDEDCLPHPGSPWSQTAHRCLSAHRTSSSPLVPKASTKTVPRAQAPGRARRACGPAATCPCEPAPIDRPDRTRSC